MSTQKNRWWSHCTLAGLLGFFLMSGKRSRRADQLEDASEPTTSPDASVTDPRHVTLTVDSTPRNEDGTPKEMPTATDSEPPATGTNPFKQITPRQWVVAAVVLVAVPVIAYLGTYYLYPYLQDLIEGESPIDTVLAEYGVDEDADTQLLTIRRGDLVNSVAVNGTLEFANRERLSFGQSGTIEAINAEGGDFVNQGDVLMALDEKAIITAEQKLQDASVALQDAEDRLNQLLNPDEKEVNDAVLNVLQSEQKLADAEEALATLLQPSDADIAAVELEIAKSAADLDAAEQNLSDLQNPDDLDLENAKLAVAEAEQNLADLKHQLAELTAKDSAEIRAAELAVSEAAKARDDAVDAYAETQSIDEIAVDQAELELEKAKLALLEAESAVEDAEEELRQAEEAGILDSLNKRELEVAKTEAALAAAKLDENEALDALREAQKPYDEEEVADLRAQIAATENDIKVAENQLQRIEIQTRAENRTLEADLAEARNTYKDTFFKWLGMDISKYQWQKSPDEIFADIGMSLAEIMQPSTISGGLWRRTSASEEWYEDDPETPWDEAVVATWTEFFLSQLRFDCTEMGTGISDECVNIEFENAWDDLIVKTEAYETARLEATQQYDSAEDTIDTAKKKLEDLEEQLEEALEPTDEDTLEDLLAKAEVAYYTQVEAELKLESLFLELRHLDPDSEVHVAVTQATQALAVANETVKVARNDLSEAEKNLADAKTGPTNVEIDIARAKANKAQSDYSEAIQALEDLRKTESPEIAVVRQRINTAETDLKDKIEELQALDIEDPVEIALARAELVSAEETLNDQIAALRELLSPDEDEVVLLSQETEVAKADFAAAQDDLDDLTNPDPATVALRRAEVATAREDLESAQAATEGGRIIAPFDGVVADIQVEEGQSINEGTVAIIIADPSIVEVSGTVDEVDVLFLQVGDTATVELEALGDEVLIGRISDIAAFGESNQGVVTYPVTIQTEQPSDTQLPEGLSAVAEVVIREQNNQLLVPIQALFGSVNKPIILVSKPDGTLEAREVTLGISDDFWTVVEGGIVEGETILMTVVGADTSQFSGFRAVSSSVRFSTRPAGGGR